MDYVSLAVALEEIAAGDGATSTVVSVQNSVVCGPIAAFGTDAQKERYLRPLAARRDAGVLLPDRAARRLRRGRDQHARRAPRRRLCSRRREAVHHLGQARRHRHRLRGDRQGRGKAGHLGVHRRDRDAGLHRGARRGQARPARLGHRADRARAMRRARCEPARRAKARATGSRCPISRRGASASPRRRSAWRAPRSTPRSRMHAIARASASRSSITRR